MIQGGRKAKLNKNRISTEPSGYFHWDLAIYLVPDSCQPYESSYLLVAGFLSSVCLQNMTVVDETLSYKLDDVTLGNLGKEQTEKPRL
jgi:hypothetical protein